MNVIKFFHGMLIKVVLSNFKHQCLSSHLHAWLCKAHFLPLLWIAWLVMYLLTAVRRLYKHLFFFSPWKTLQEPYGIQPRILCNGNEAISNLQTKMGFSRTSVSACTIHKSTFSSPFGIFYVRTETWKEFFQIKSNTPPNWVFLMSN